MPGRRPKPYPCPLCQQPATRSDNSIYFECECGGRLVLEKGRLRETRAYSQREEVETVEAPRLRCSADEFEELQS